MKSTPQTEQRQRIVLRCEVTWHGNGWKSLRVLVAAILTTALTGMGLGRWLGH